MSACRRTPRQYEAVQMPSGQQPNSACRKTQYSQLRSSTQQYGCRLGNSADAVWAAVRAAVEWRLPSVSRQNKAVGGSRGAIWTAALIMPIGRLSTRQYCALAGKIAPHCRVLSGTSRCEAAPSQRGAPRVATTRLGRGRCANPSTKLGLKCAHHRCLSQFGAYISGRSLC